MTAGEDELCALGVIQEGKTRQPAGEPQRRFERLRQALLRVGPQAEAIDYRLDRVLALRIELRQAFHVMDSAIDAHAHEALIAQ